MMHYLTRAIRAGLLFCLLGLIACSRPDEEPVAPVAPTATATLAPANTPQPAEAGSLSFITVATDAPSRLRNFADIDEFGTVVGFEPDVMSAISAEGDFEHEFVVTSFDGLLASVANGEFDAAMAALLIPPEPVEGIVFTIPYLEVGQVMVVRANERVLQSYTDLQPGILVGVVTNSAGQVAARDVLGVAEEELVFFEGSPAALQALYDGAIGAAIIDSEDAVHFTTTFPQALKIAGGEGREAWITSRAYGIAVAEANSPLLEALNNAISLAQSSGQIDRAIRGWLVPGESIAAAESLVGTPADEIVIGLVGQPSSMDPASGRDIVSWEIKVNTSSGLLMLSADNTLAPALAADLPTVSADGLEYTFGLRAGLAFPDGSEFNAEDVRWSLLRAARLPNLMVRDYLKDADGDSYTDEDAVQVIDAQTVKIALARPIGHFPYMLATPPYFVLNSGCDPSAFDPTGACAGIGPYRVVEWEQGAQMRLEANRAWPGPPAAFAKLRLRFYDDPARMRASLENSAIDLAWTGLTVADATALRTAPGFEYWSGPAVFKSYLVFEQSQPPWDDERVRQAAAYAVDRQAIATTIFGDTRQPLFSPVPGAAPGRIDSEPARDLERARALLTAAGFSATEPLTTTLWFISDGRYTPLEEAYANALKSQLEETGIFKIALRGEPYDFFIGQASTCNAPAFLLGWPPRGWPPAYLGVLDWLEYFVRDAAQVCSNYQSEEMTALLDQAGAALTEAERTALYSQLQTLWAQEYPTLDLLQEPRFAVSLDKLDSVRIDAMGFLHYDLLTKSE
jgi:peptide/nickel transport system substrate-binding protein